MVNFQGIMQKPSQQPLVAAVRAFWLLFLGFFAFDLRFIYVILILAPGTAKLRVGAVA